MPRARGANAKLAGIFESTYGTNPAASGNYIGLPFISSALGAEQGLLESDLLGNGRESYDPTYDVITNDGDVVVPVDVRYFGYWLKLLLGAPSTSGSDPYTHLFTSGSASLPSMSIEHQYVDVSKYEMNYGIRGNSMSIALSRRGLLNATVSCIAKGSDPIGTTQAGTLVTALEMDRFAQATGYIKREGSVLGSIVSANLNYTNNLEKIETIQPDGEIEDADGGTFMATGDIVARFANTTLMDDSTDQTPIELEFGWTFGDHSLLFNMPRVFLPRVKKPISGPAGIQANFAWQASGEGAASMTATLVNDKATY